MTIRSSLFTKIFFWFWLAMTLVGIVLLALEASRTQELTRRWYGVTGDAFATYAVASAEAAEEKPRPASGKPLGKYLRELEARTRIRARVLDERDREITPDGRATPLSQPEWMAERMKRLAQRARASGQTEFEPQAGGTLAARLAVGPSGRRFILLGELPAARYGPWIPDPRVQALRLLAVLGTAAAVCWGLGRHLTAPIVALREAARRMACGDFSARAAQTLHGRHDELASLARDFDLMAARIQSLMQEKERLLEEQKVLMGAQRRLLGDVSHELRSPLARVNVALEMARDRADTLREAVGEAAGVGLVEPPARSSTLADAHNRIEREAQHLNALIDRLLTLSRLESGVSLPPPHPENLADLVNSVASDANFEAHPSRRVVSVVACDNCVTLATDNLLRSAIENVVRNAVSYAPEDTTVEIALRLVEAEDQSKALISVRDQGPGVPEAELREVFRPFYRAAGARARSGSGGLGLAITARAVELHGGTVRAHNEPEGGLTVEIRLPLVDG